MPGCVERAGDRAQGARPGRRDGQDRLGRQLGGRKPSKTMRSNWSVPGGARVLLGRGAVQLDVGQQRQRVLEVDVAGADEQDALQSVAGHDRPGGVVERQLVGRTGRRGASVRSGWLVGGRQPRLDDACPAGSSSMTTCVWVSGSRNRSRAVNGLPSARIWSRRATALDVEVGDAHEEPALEAAGVGLDGQRGDRLVVPFAPDRQDANGRLGRSVGAALPASSVTTRISAPRARDGERVGQRERLGQVAAGRWTARCHSMARVARPRSVASLATTRAVSPAATTLTRPSDGSSASASAAARLAAVSRSGKTSVAPMLAEASTTSTRSRARPAGRSRKGRAAARTRISDQQELEQQQQRSPQPLPRRVGLDVAHELLPQERAADRPLLAPQPEHVEGDDERDEGQAGEGQRRQEGHRSSPAACQATTRRRRSSAKTRSASGSVDGHRHERRPALGRDRVQSLPARPRVAPGRRRASTGRP